MKAAEQMVDMVGKINRFISAREGPVNLQKVDIQEITETLRTEFAPILGKRKILWPGQVGSGEIIADKSALLRIFRNLIDNALKHGGKGMTRLTIRHREESNFHVFSFSDNGVGIKEKDRGMIFEKFCRPERSGGAMGAGLGLAIVKELAELHGGRIWVDKGVKHGATFYVSIPKSPEITH